MSGWRPTREAGLQRLRAFIPSTAKAYAERRNVDEGWDGEAPAGPERRRAVSGLSPWIQRRLVLEREVVQEVLTAHGPRAAETFIQEVMWRTYWKGWLAMRPSVWEDYLDDRDRDSRLVESNGRLRRVYERARQSQTGIDCFDHWCHELRATGYLHNHVRMWFASIWTFTLELPWTLGAALFERHLLDADAASNTLSWRWVAGLHTRGKHYVARAENIRRFTSGRFDPAGALAQSPAALHEQRDHPREPLPMFDPIEPGPRSGLLLTTEDLTPERSELRELPFASIAGGLPGSVFDHAAPRIHQFNADALDDGLRRAASSFEVHTSRLPDGPEYTSAVTAWARSADLDRVVAFAPQIGPWIEPFERLATELRSVDIELVLHRRAWDRDLFPHATAGYFKFKKAIPAVLRALS